MSDTTLSPVAGTARWLIVAALSAAAACVLALAPAPGANEADVADAAWGRP